MSASLKVPTDRGEPTRESGVGIDTLAVVGPVQLRTLQELSTISHKRLIDRDTAEITDYAPSGFHSLNIGAARVGVSAWVSGAGPQIRLQASIPRMLLGHNWDGVSPDELPRAMEVLMRGVAEALPDTPRPHEVAVTRLDLTRDFYGVRDVPATLTAIARHPMANVRVNRRDYREDGVTLQTLTRGNRSWIARGYDKWFESANSKGPGLQRELARTRPQQLRFEVELKSKALRYRGMTKIADLLRSDLIETARYYFERCKFDVNTAQTGLSDLLDRLESDGVSAADRRNLVLYLTCADMGVSLLSRGPFERARALANRYRLGPNSLGKSTFERRLDFDLASEVVC
ncbi:MULTISPECIES: phage/plasmid replication protein [unclassified Nocardioides]|uniref:phage/plasmid replication domain-containing protein n=1 Tax=unclassified Nocardioides TaxID=2615069 RepID=UPI0000571334|nr:MULTISPECIES: phage/plasmid replication protein [unclassified Nocardioides]ABL81479.1 hypothetical protein Noca_1969 [Nocardioides sp. JS614]